jgi:hypothetical protein
MFALWGVGGFVLTLFATLGASILQVTAAGVTWIGGMLFFGLGALIATPNYAMSDVLSVGIYKGMKYREMVDHSVQVDTKDGPVTYPNVPAFRSAVTEKHSR